MAEIPAPETKNAPEEPGESRPVVVQKEKEEAIAIELRFVFVEMLFALAIAEVATRAANLVLSGVKITEVAYPYTHLLLATLIIASSWIGWKNSAATGNKSPVKEIFSPGFLVLLLDVALVIFYFILVRGVEEPSNSEIKASAENETTWSLIIFIGYFAWDVLTKAVPLSGNKGIIRRLFSKNLWGRGWVSAGCAFLTLLIWGFFHNATAPDVVVLTDVTLILLVLLFRALKEWLNKDAHTPGIVSIICALLFLVSLIGTLFCQVMHSGGNVTNRS